MPDAGPGTRKELRRGDECTVMRVAFAAAPS
jgi:hypothetical protein